LNENKQIDVTVLCFDLFLFLFICQGSVVHPCSSSSQRIKTSCISYYIQGVSKKKVSIQETLKWAVSLTSTLTRWMAGTCIAQGCCLKKVFFSFKKRLIDACLLIVHSSKQASNGYILPQFISD